MAWPSEQAGEALPIALYWMFMSHLALKQPDLALQAGEKMLKEYPLHSYTGGLSGVMQMQIDTMKRRETEKERAERQLARVETDLAQLDLKRCNMLYDHGAWEQAIAWCRATAEKHAGVEDRREIVARARWLTAESLVETSRFVEARREAEALMKAHPEHAKKIRVRSRVRSWPKED